MPAAKAYWKQFVELATDFAHKYRFDLFFRTEVNIILLQIAFSFTVLVIIASAMNYLYQDVSTTVVQGVIESPAVVTTPSAERALLLNLERAKTENLSIVVTVTILLTAAFGYLIARITLKPTRDALSFQKQFIGNIAHELRTPLATIKTNTEVALLESDLSQHIKQTMKSNVEELDRISDIINNLLSLNAFIRPERITFSNTDLNTVVSRVVKRLQSLSERRQVAVHTHTQKETLVHGNETALEQIVLNLLKNALSYTSPGGEVHITVTPSYQGLVMLSVADTGIGISRKDLFHIFEPFYRADHSRARRHGGSGLGLAIVSELVRIHHGRISIRSTPKKGTTVEILLPKGEHDTLAGEHLPPPSANQVAIDFSHTKKES